MNRDPCRLRGGTFLHAPNTARNIAHSFKSGDRRTAFLLASGWEAPLWVLASVMHGRFEVDEEDELDVLVHPAENEEVELDEVLAILGLKDQPEED